MNQILNLTLADVLGDYLTGVGILTEGRHFQYDPVTKVGSSGWWKMNVQRAEQASGVAVCVRENRTNGNSTIYVGTITGMVKNEDGRVQIFFKCDRIIETGNVVWTDFAAGSYPVRYYPD